MTKETEKNIALFRKYQEVILETFTEEWEAGKLKNRGEVQLQYAMEYFEIARSIRQLKLEEE